MPALRKPLFTLRPDNQGRRLYANVDNELLIVDDTMTVRDRKHIVVGAELFTLMFDVMHVPPTDRVRLYLCEDGPNKHVLSMHSSGDEEMTDLWAVPTAEVTALMRG